MDIDGVELCGIGGEGDLTTGGGTGTSSSAAASSSSSSSTAASALIMAGDRSSSSRRNKTGKSRAETESSFVERIKEKNDRERMDVSQSTSSKNKSATNKAAPVIDEWRPFADRSVGLVTLATGYDSDDLDTVEVSKRWVTSNGKLQLPKKLKINLSGIELDQWEVNREFEFKSFAKRMRERMWKVCESTSCTFANKNTALEFPSTLDSYIQDLMKKPKIEFEAAIAQVNLSYHPPPESRGVRPSTKKSGATAATAAAAPGAAATGASTTSDLSAVCASLKSKPVKMIFKKNSAAAASEFFNHVRIKDTPAPTGPMGFSFFPPIVAAGSATFTLSNDDRDLLKENFNFENILSSFEFKNSNISNIKGEGEDEFLDKSLMDDWHVFETEDVHKLERRIQHILRWLEAKKVEDNTSDLSSAAASSSASFSSSSSSSSSKGSGKSSSKSSKSSDNKLRFLIEDFELISAPIDNAYD